MRGGREGDGTELGAGGEVWAWLGRINAERDWGWWGDWVGLRDVDPALSLAVAGSGAASGPGRPCSPSVPRDPGIFGLSRPALCNPGQSKVAGRSKGSRPEYAMESMADWAIEKPFDRTASSCPLQTPRNRQAAQRPWFKYNHRPGEILSRSDCRMASCA